MHELGTDRPAIGLLQDLDDLPEFGFRHKKVGRCEFAFEISVGQTEDFRP